MQLEDATKSFERAIALDSQFATAYLHIGIVDSYQGRSEQSVAAYENAERLYVAASNIEGQTEVLIRKGLHFTGQGEYAKAKPFLERAIASAETLKSPFHLVRAQLALSEVVASQGHFSDAEALAQKATANALESDLDVVAAEGLTDLAITLHFAHRTADALAILGRARR